MSTLFLLDALAPESRAGRVWDKFLHSRSLWLQILCVLLVAWVISQPRWVRNNATQSMVFVMDDSVQMQPFKERAIQAISRDMDQINAWGIPTRWIIMGSSGRKKNIFQGTDRKQALQSLEAWTPDAGEHDPAPALKTAALVARETGITRFITHAEKRAPKWQSSSGVGVPMNNVGIVGITPVEQAGTPQWRIAVKNNSKSVQSREMSVQSEKGARVAKTISLPPGAVSEFQIALPEEADATTVSLSPDEFTRDDNLPLVRPHPKPIAVHIDLAGPLAKFFEKIALSIPGASIGNDAGKPSLLITEKSTLSGMTPSSASPPMIILASSSRREQSGAPVIAERNPLTQDLSWGGMLLPSSGSLTPGANASILLWKGNLPLVWAEGNTLVLNWEWKKSNADRLPSTTLLIRRFIDSIRSSSKEEEALNIPASTALDVPSGTTIEFSPLKGEKITSPFSGISPGSPGFFSIFDESNRRLVHGATFTGDARDGDFSACSTFDQALPDRKKLAEKISSPDPFVTLWLALAGIALVWSWIPTAQERRLVR